METQSTQRPETWQAPMELQCSTPRLVRLTSAGFTTVIVAAVLAITGITLGGWLNDRAAKDARQWQEWQAEAIPARGRVTDLRRSGTGKNRVYRAEYAYQAAGGEYVGSGRIKEREWRWLNKGDAIEVFYRRSEPGQSWISGHEPKGVPGWVAPVVGVPMLLIAVLLASGVRRERRLLEQGWPVNATVTKVATLQLKQGKAAYRVDYQFQTSNGDAITGRMQVTNNIPSEGSMMTVLYLPDKPKTNAAYPLNLVQPANM